MPQQACTCVSKIPGYAAGAGSLRPRFSWSTDFLREAFLAGAGGTYYWPKRCPNMRLIQIARALHLAEHKVPLTNSDVFADQASAHGMCRYCSNAYHKMKGVLHGLREAIKVYLNLPGLLDDSGNVLLPSTFAGAPGLEACARGQCARGFAGSLWRLRGRARKAAELAWNLCSLAPCLC